MEPYFRERGAVRVSVLAVLALVGALTVAGGLSPVQATFPGTNGLIAFTRTGEIFTVNPGTLGETRLTFTGNNSNPNWNNQGTQLVVEILGGPLALLNPVPGSAPVGIPATIAADDDAAFFPAGNKVAFHSTGAGAIDDIFTVDTNGANRTNLTNTAGAAERDPDVSSDGLFIAFENDTTGHIERIGPTGALRLQITPAAACVAGANDCDDPSVYPNNARVAYDKDGANQGIQSVASDGSSAAPQQLTVLNDDDPAVSPDGTRVVFDVTGVGPLFSTDTAGSTARTQVSVTGANDDDPSWAIAAAAPGSPVPGVSPVPPVPPGQIAIVRDPVTGCANAASTAAAQAAGYSVGCSQKKGTSGRDLLVAGNGYAGKINAGKGNDCVLAQNGLRNKVKGGKGNDTLASSDADDKAKKFEATTLGTCPA